MTYTSYHLAISKKLGWSDMFADIALPTVDRIINNHIGHINDCTGDVVDAEYAAASLLQNSWTPDDIFGLLVSPDYETWMNEKDLFVSYRSEIEMLMRSGFDFVSSNVYKEQQLN